MTDGFWSGAGTPASVDWCEPNYVITQYVAEFWNTTSSLLIVAAGLAGVLHCARAGRRVEARFWWGFAALAVIGVGSTLFHGTLLKLPQASDELPMVWGSLIFVYIIRFRGVESGGNEVRRRWQLGLGLYAVFFTVGYFALKTYFTFFIWTYAALVTYLVVRSLVISWQGGALRRRVLTIAVLTYVGGFALLWIPEHVLLACDHPFQAGQPHAFFHITSAVGTYLWILWSFVDRELNHGHALKVSGVVPFAHRIGAPQSQGGD